MLALVYLGLAICVGERLCSRFYRFVSVAHRWATGTLVGLLLSSCFTYLAARHFAGANNPLLWGDILFFGAAAIFLLKCPPRREPSMIEPRVSGSATWDWITLGLYCALAIWMMFATLDLKDGRLLIGITQWSDYGPNTAIVRNFAVGHNFPAEYPHFAGEPIRYHFLFYLLAGNLEFLGLNLVWSLNLLSVLTLVCMLALVMALAQLLFKSRAVGRLAATLFFFHGTLNLIPFFQKQTSFKGALKAIYNLPNYLTSGFPYRGEDWGVWTQVVYINQRHLASSIGIFLVVLIFLFDRYLERARQKELARALRVAAGPSSPPRVSWPSFSAWIPKRFVRRRPKEQIPITDTASTPEELTSLEQSPQTSSIATTGEAQPSDALESLQESAQEADIAPGGEPPKSDPLTGDEQSRPEPDIASSTEGQAPDSVNPFKGSAQVANAAPAGELRKSDTVVDDKRSQPEPDVAAPGEAHSPDTLKSSKESTQAAHDVSAGEPPKSDIRAIEEQGPLEPDSASVGDVTPSEIEQSREESSEAAHLASAGETKTFNTRAYDEYMRQSIASASEARESEALEVVKQSSWKEDTLPAPEAQTSDPSFPVEELPLGSDASSASEPQSPSTPPVAASSRGIFAALVHDNLVSGRGFIFSGLLLGALPYWNAAVFTAAFAVLSLFFVLFPYRRYMVGLAITAAVVGLPQILSLRSGNTRAGAHLLHWGYTLGNVPMLQVVKYIGFTFGVKWVLILIALIFFSWRHFRLFLAISILFVLTFCFRFSEEALANHKFLNIWLVLANLFVAYGLWRLWHLRIKGWAIPSRLVAILLATPIIVGGGIDFFPIHNGGFVYTNFTNDRLINWIRTETKPDAVFLTDKFVNHPILLGGRRIWFGYTYFTWSAGYDLPKREPAYRQMFESKNAHQVFTLLKSNGIDYVAFDGGIRAFAKPSNEELVYAPNFKKVFEGPEYWQLAIYKVPENADFVPASPGLPGGAQAPGISAFDGGKGKENGQFDFPRGLVFDAGGNMLVADTNNGRIQKFSPTGMFLSLIGKMGQRPGEFKEPCGIALDASGNIYVADVGNARVQKLKPDGTFLAEWKGPEPGFYGPRDLAVGPDNSVYVVDQGHARIIKFDSNGKVLVVWGTSGTGDGQFIEPTSVAVDDKNNRVYVADPRSKRIEVFDTNGKFIAKWVVEEWAAPSGWHFHDLAIDSQAGLVYVSSGGEVFVFDLTGKRVNTIKPTTPPYKFEGSSAIALLKNSLYVVDTFSCRVSRIELGKK